MAQSNFESSLNKLEKIVQKLEAGELSLDKSIEQYEQGIELYKNCREFLTKAEQKVQVLTDSLKEEDYTD